MRSIGIDLGEDSVKLVELFQNKKSVVIHSIFEKRLSSGTSEHDREIEAIEYVRHVLSQNDFSSTRFCMAIPQDKVTIRTKTFPFSDRIKIQKSLAFEMEEDIPFHTENCLFDYKVISYDGAGCTVLAVAVPKTHIEKSLSLAKDFGIELHTLTIEGLAFTNLLENWEETPPFVSAPTLPLADSSDSDFTDRGPRKKIQVILNIGHHHTLVLGTAEGRVVFVRSLLWGTDHIIQEMLRKYQIPYAEAHKILQTQFELPLNKQNKSFEELNLLATVEKALRDLVRDLQISFLELQSEQHGTIASVQFTGGLSQLTHLGAFLTQHLEVACNPVFLLNAYLQNKDYGGYSAVDIQSRFAIVTAIAIEAYKKPRNPALQLMKGEFVQGNNRLKALWQDWGTFAQVVMAAICVLFVWGYFRESFSTTLAEKGTEALSDQARKVARLPKRQANESGVTKYIKENKKRAQEMKLVSQIAGMNSALDILKKVSENSPSKEQVKVDLMRFDIQDELVHVAGYADTPREVSLFSERLSAMAADKKVSQENTTLSAIPNRVAFAFNFKMDRGLVK